ncbi:MAG: hypothetical protein ACFFB2_13875 [Promethearchaeota archaeon]
MIENWMSLEVTKHSFHECLFLLTSHNRASKYCLTLKLWHESCPPRCPYYKAGPLGSVEELEVRKYILYCRKFTRKLITKNEAIPYCKQYFMREPFCQKCHYSQKDL